MHPALVLAGLVAVVHAASIAYVVLGGFLALRDVRWLWPHLAGVAWVVVSGSLLDVCPLTALEKWLVLQGGGTPYDGYFISHYLVGRLYPTTVADAVRDLATVVILGSWAVVAQRHVLARRTRTLV